MQLSACAVKSQWSYVPVQLSTYAVKYFSYSSANGYSGAAMAEFVMTPGSLRGGLGFEPSVDQFRRR